MFEKILLAIDGSEYSVPAIHAATELAARVGATVDVLHVHEHEVALSKAGAGPFEPETPEEAAKLVNDALATLRTRGVSAKGTVRIAPTRRVPDEILEAAATGGAGLIVVGTRGLSSLSGMLLGSVSTKVVHLARCPVMVAR